MREMIERKEEWILKSDEDEKSILRVMDIEVGEDLVKVLIIIKIEGIEE